MTPHGSDSRRDRIVARDLMTSPVISVALTTTVSGAAQLMINHHLGALPVVDASGAVVGMVSDGDLLGRRPEHDRREWWLSLVARATESSELPPQRLSRPVSEVMSSPVISISPTTTLDVIAEMLQLHRLKRLPVLEDGKLVGIVSRTDVATLGTRALPGQPGSSNASGLIEFLESLIGGASLLGALTPSKVKLPEPPQAETSAEFSAKSLRARVHALKTDNRDLNEAKRLAARREREREVKALLDKHVSREMWRSLMRHAEVAAANGERELLMLRFPCALCSDGGRMIDVNEEGWESTLRGEAAEMFASWRDELKPLGFRLAARIDSYDADGVIGEIGLYLIWGE